MEAREAKQRMEREKRDDEHAQALRLTLCELQLTMDQLLTTQIYNIHFCFAPSTCRYHQDGIRGRRRINTHCVSIYCQPDDVFLTS
jgi:hypothetical protein